MLRVSATFSHAFHRLTNLRPLRLHQRRRNAIVNLQPMNQLQVQHGHLRRFCDSHSFAFASCVACMPGRSSLRIPRFEWLGNTDRIAQSKHTWNGSRFPTTHVASFGQSPSFAGDIAGTSYFGFHSQRSITHSKSRPSSRRPAHPLPPGRAEFRAAHTSRATRSRCSRGGLDVRRLVLVNCDPQPRRARTTRRRTASLAALRWVSRDRPGV